jgi:transposase
MELVERGGRRGDHPSAALMGSLWQTVIGPYGFLSASTWEMSLGDVLVGIEATGSMQWFLRLMKELKIDCQVGHPAKIRAAEPRKQKHDRRDALLLPNQRLFSDDF